MKENQRHLLELLEKQAWTDQEKRWFLNYLENTEHQEELKLLLEEQFLSPRLLNESFDPALSQRMLKAIHEKAGIEQAARKTPVVSMWGLRAAVAASVIALLVLGSYLWFGKAPGRDVAQTETKSKKHKNDVLPGGSKAMLMLADGSSLVLDSSQNGALTQQGNTRVLKLGKKLVYDPGTGTASEIVYNTLVTPRGGQYQLELPDGSQVWLNAASSLRFPSAFAGKERKVEVTGEAYFEVAKNAKMPFVVSVEGAEVQVLGTHFNIMAYKDEEAVKTTLLEGAVKFVRADQGSFLKPGQQARLSKEGKVSVVSGVDVEAVVAWKNGVFHFESADIETVMRQLSRWYDVDIVFKGKRRFDPLYADIPRNSRLSDVLDALELSGGAKFIIEGKRIVVMQ